MEVAVSISSLATCNRLHVGAVLVSRSNKIISTGYNGAPRGLPHCDDIGHLIVNNHCLRSVHAETNAINQAWEDNRNVLGATLYCTHFPCVDCSKNLVRAGISRLVYKHRYNPCDESVLILEAAGLEIITLEV
jgi:dCMP deaminase